MRAQIQLIAFILLAGISLAFGWNIYKAQIRQEKLIAEASVLGNYMSAYSQQSEKAADIMSQRIGYLVYKNRSQTRDQAVLHQAEQIVDRADAMADSLGGLSLLLGLTDARPTSTRIPYLTCDFPSGLDNRGLKLLAQHLDRYVAFIRRYVPHAHSLTRPAEPLLEPACFSVYYFQNAPEASARATLERLIAEVRRYEVDALSVQAQKVSSNCICFDRLAAVAVPASSTIEPGGIYEAQLLLAESFSQFYYKQMSVNGRKVQRFENEQGLVEIPIPKSAGSRADTLRAEWQGLIQARLYPADSTWRLTVPFWVLNRPTP
ncbi:hypothetical protein Q5H92_23140 [Hymenobacter sp. M29]|uniref:Gliding motility-associated protein GldM first immunoglobulin-like domain-containing protein n=1 Tax=Hymenobacter mellowenesis TaxID=3063995 RepID=A0ABT9AHC5_9BACT|nr:hypothetical protein [Hymenobacter sp. M29]MDO7849278.1 hypothetical protein [Hymenobacter sp. M29]